MKTYIDHGSTIVFGKQLIPKDPSNKQYAEFLHELEKNESELILQHQVVTWENIKKIRDGLLTDSDWTDLPNTPLKNKQAWIDYRQELRDLPQAFRTAEEVVWPKKP
jgi:hypothetical protein